MKRIFEPTQPNTQQNGAHVAIKRVKDETGNANNGVSSNESTMAGTKTTTNMTNNNNNDNNNSNNNNSMNTSSNTSTNTINDGIVINNNIDPSATPVIRVVIEKLLYPVTLDALHEVFSKAGKVDKIVTFQKGGKFQALIQFESINGARSAKQKLDRQDIYPSACSMRIDFSKMATLNVRFNNDKSRDYTNPLLPPGPSALPPSDNGGGPHHHHQQQQHTVQPAQQQQPTHSHHHHLQPHHHNMPVHHLGTIHNLNQTTTNGPSGVPSADPRLLGTSPAPQTPSVSTQSSLPVISTPPPLQHSNMTHLDHSTGNQHQLDHHHQLASAQTLAAITNPALHPSFSAFAAAFASMQRSNHTDSPAQAAASLMALTNGQGLSQASQLALAAIHQQALHDHQRASALPYAISPVLLAFNLDEQLATPEALFTLFGVFGDVMRVKILFNKKDNALIQMAEPAQAETARIHLDKKKVFNKIIRVMPSKHREVQLPRDPNQSDAGLTKDFANSHLHRFKIPGSRNYQNIYPPSSTLHLSNIPATVSEEELGAAFERECSFSFSNFKFFPKDRKMALVCFNSTEQAIIALIKMHNYKIIDDVHLRVSFSKSPIQ